MKSYAEREVFNANELRLLKQATALVARVPAEGRDVRCHELARAVGLILGLPVHDGAFGFVEHTWLWTAEPNAMLRDERSPMWMLPNILDVYVPGSLPQVQLVHLSTGLPARYRSGKPREDVQQDVVLELLRVMRGVLGPRCKYCGEPVDEEGQVHAGGCGRVG